MVGFCGDRNALSLCMARHAVLAAAVAFVLLLASVLWSATPALSRDDARMVHGQVLVPADGREVAASDAVLPTVTAALTPGAAAVTAVATTSATPVVASTTNIAAAPTASPMPAVTATATTAPAAAAVRAAVAAALPKELPAHVPGMDTVPFPVPAQCPMPRVFAFHKSHLLMNRTYMAAAARNADAGGGTLPPAPDDAALCALDDAWAQSIFDPAAIRAVAAKRRGAIVEVGCNTACESRSLRQRESRFFVGVEPVPSYARRNFYRGRCDVVWQAVIGPSRGAVNFNVGDTVSSVLQQQSASVDSNGRVVNVSRKQLAVASIRLEDLLKWSVPAPMRVQVLAVDAQGFDLDVVQSGGTQLSRVDNIIVECQHLPPIDVRWLYRGAPNCSAMAAAIETLGFALDRCYINLGPSEFNCLFHRVPTGQHRDPYVLSLHDITVLMCPLGTCRWETRNLTATPPMMSEQGHIDAPNRAALDRAYVEKIECLNAGFAERLRRGETVLQPLKLPECQQQIAAYEVLLADARVKRNKKH